MSRFVAPRLLRALKKTRVRVSNGAYVHLVNAVALPVYDTVLRDRLARREPLAVTYQKAMDRSITSPERLMLFREVGDRSLINCALWVDERFGDLSYYITLGRTAYDLVGGEPYRELADKYSQLADAFLLLMANYIAGRESRMVALYQAWQRLHDPHVGRVLLRIGFPLDDPSLSTAVPS